MKKKIKYFFRKPTSSCSIERVFGDIKTEVSKEFGIGFYINRYKTEGVFKRIYDIIGSSLNQSDINHVTGDVHYLTYLLLKRKTILTIHDIGTYYRLKGLKKIIFWIFWIWLPIKRCAVITTDSRTIKHELLKVTNCAPQKIKVLYAPVCEIYKPSIKIFNPKKIRILHIGSTDNKNLKNHVEALKNRDIVFELAIICSDPKKVRNILRSVNFKFSIFSNLSLKNVYQQYKLCDIILFSSLYEGFGLPIIEAQAVGRPVVTSNYGSMKEISNGTTCLVNPKDPSSIYAGLEKIIKDKKYRDSLVVGGFKNVERFSAQKIGRDYINLYKKILN
jgi:glycosyltransferase involved in cell wall biosynthesis